MRAEISIEISCQDRGRDDYPGNLNLSNEGGSMVTISCRDLTKNIEVNAGELLRAVKMLVANQEA